MISEVRLCISAGSSFHSDDAARQNARSPTRLIDGRVERVAGPDLAGGRPGAQPVRIFTWKGTGEVLWPLMGGRHVTI